MRALLRSACGAVPARAHAPLWLLASALCAWVFVACARTLGHVPKQRPAADTAATAACLAASAAAAGAQLMALPCLARACGGVGAAAAVAAVVAAADAAAGAALLVVYVRPQDALGQAAANIEPLRQALGVLALLLAAEAASAAAAAAASLAAAAIFPHFRQRRKAA